MSSFWGKLKQYAVEIDQEIRLSESNNQNTGGAYIEKGAKIQAYALPSEAIVHFEGKDYNFRGTGKNRFEMTEVTLGENESGHTEILLRSNRDLLASAIVFKGAYTLLMMLKNKQE